MCGMCLAHTASIVEGASDTLGWVLLSFTRQVMCALAKLRSQTSRQSYKVPTEFYGPQSRNHSISLTCRYRIALESNCSWEAE